jgi:hypothetical protein
MTSPIPPSLERFGEELSRAAHRELSTPPGPVRARVGARRPRFLAGGTLGLAGVGAALLLALGGTTATSPAFAVTRQHDGSVLVKVNLDVKEAWVAGAERELASMGIHEQIMPSYQPGQAPVSGPVTCTPLGGVNTPSGPPVKVLLGTDGTQMIPSGTTGAGSTIHVSSCVYYKTPIPGGDNTGNTGAS